MVAYGASITSWLPPWYQAYWPETSHGLALKPLLQVVSDPNSVGNRSQGGIHRRNTREKAGVYHIEIVKVMGLAVDIKYGGSGVGAKTTGTGLMCHSSNGHGTLNIDLTLN